jgi:uncharacterized membrane protein
MSTDNNSRIISLDLLRGAVMVIMALDHVRDYVHYGAFMADPTNLTTTTPALFFTRWITHFCAPVFVFLAGTSAYMYDIKRSDKRKTARFLWTRGLWLIFLELTIVNFSLTLDVHKSLWILEVIWAIGFSMICLSALIFLPRMWLMAIGLILVFGHNLTDGLPVQGFDPLSILWYVFHRPNALFLSPDNAILIGYPVLPWIGVMTLGYVFGGLYQPDFDPSRRKAWLLRLGFSAIALFLLLRTFNVYGDARLWAPQSTLAFSVISFFNTTKYPPSLLFLLMTLGPAMLFLYAVEGVRNKITSFFVTFGRVPLFYFIIHLYLAHLLGVIGVLNQGRPWTDIVLNVKALSSTALQGYGYSLPVTYLAWMGVVLIMYPLCRWYERYKRNHRDKWWLSYL